jgi:UDP-N-acetylmuramyl-tripeptide synthetase
MFLNTNGVVSWLHKHAVRNLCLDSREIEVGDAYVVLAGATHDATRFIPQAIERGAAALLIDSETDFVRNGQAVALPHLAVPELRQTLSSLADSWYGQPSRALQVIGVTGTNGKTSSAQWIAKGLQYVGQAAGTMGTLGCTGLATPPKHEYTTPDVLSMHRWLRLFSDNHVNTVAIEVSSHALDQHRADDVHFHTALYTNLSRDHLDYHSSLEAYGEAKARLFTHHHVERAVINIDDSWGQTLVQRWKNSHPGAPLLTLSLEQPADLNAKVHDSPAGLELALKTPYGSDTILLPHLNGHFNASNILGVIGVWLHLGLSWSQIVTLLPGIEPVPGRMNKFGGKNGAPTVIVDYAHTPDALEKVLLALHPLRDTTGGKLWCIFGAGGDRDPGKRPLMGRIAAQFADKIVITSDNPRSEEPGVIAQDIYAGIPEQSRHFVQVEVDRRQAIAQTLSAAASGDIVVITGKGHEPYQEVKGIRSPFSDAEEVQKWSHAQ